MAAVALEGLNSGAAAQKPAGNQEYYELRAYRLKSGGSHELLDAYLEKTSGTEGTLVTKQDNLTKSASNINTQVASLERTVQSDRQRLIDSFVSMETAQAQIHQQLQFLQQRFGSTA